MNPFHHWKVRDRLFVVFLKLNVVGDKRVHENIQVEILVWFEVHRLLLGRRYLDSATKRIFVPENSLDSRTDGTRNRECTQPHERT